MLKEVDWSEDRTYRSWSENEPMQFYLDGLSNSKKLDLLLGYFSSAAINILSLGFATFLYSGGRLRMVINSVLSENDRDAIKNGAMGQMPNNIIDLTDIKGLKDKLDGYGKHFFECLAWLIANERIQIKIIRPKSQRGIAHYKSGIFADETDSVAFKASCNFTAFGLLENLEELDAFLSWEDSRSKSTIARQSQDFEHLFSGKADFVDYLDVEDVIIAIRSEFESKTLDELVIQEKDLLEKKGRTLDNRKLKKTAEKIIKKIEAIAEEPRFPYPQGPRPYQSIAYSNWIGNNYKGIFSMATGTGKTITSLNCLLNEYKKDGSYKALVVVPTISLLDQWKKECLKFNFRNIITVSSKENWNDSLSFLNTATTLINTSFIVIVTYASLIKSKFKSHFTQLPKETLLIADEVHNMGAPGILTFLPSIHLQKRIGLSATPNRKYDAEGNLTIEGFFNDKFPYLFSFSMKEALDIGWLCRYLYYPHIVELIEDELKEYIKISKQLLRFMDGETGRYKECKEVEELLLRRKKIIHKAFNKKAAFKKVLRHEFKRKGDLKYTLVYVPEGVESNFLSSDLSLEDEEEVRLINEYTTIVKDTDDSVMVKQFTSGTGNRNEVLKDFENGIVHVLTSMKCLDEGVDIPRSELAIFCASTGNPRQFIQRRGRVLRTHQDKIYAVIHDLVVVPKVNRAENNYEMERSLLRKELERVVDFSEMSMNKIDAYDELKEVLDFYNLNLYDLV
jgi:superfamily II DNA or RNA helicase